MKALSIAATGMLAQQLNVEVISNNLANMTTTGYKRQRAEFQDLLYQDLRRVGSSSSEAGTIIPSGIQVGLGVKPAAVYRIIQQGNLTITDNVFDLAIDGQGYFMVELPSGETGYTRAGSFQANGEGDLVNADGYIVQPGVTVPEDAVSVTINPDGQVFIKLEGQVEPQNVGQIELAIFANPGGLDAIGDNLFLETPGSGAANVGTATATGFGSIKQGMLETSNVQVVAEITNLIAAQRAYEMNSRVIQTSDEMLASVVQLR